MGLRYLATATARSVRQDGVRSTVGLARDYVGARFFPTPSDETVRRFRLGQRISEQLGSVVSFGPFTGLRLDDNSWWGAADRGAMLLGFYEQEVLYWLASACDGRSTLVDLGAADGYYAIGCVKAGLVERAIAFEAAEEGRRAIRVNAAVNGVADRLEVHGLASDGFAADLVRSDGVDFRDAVVIVDIEGAEFEILTADCLVTMEGARIVVELHEWVDGAGEGLQRILADCAYLFSPRFLVTGSRDLSGYDLLRDWSDDDRWILCSESRQRLMRWLVLEPRERTAS